MRHPAIRIAALAAFLLPAPRVFSQVSEEKPVDASAAVQPATVAPGGEGKLILKLELLEGAHVNASVVNDPELIATSFTPKPAPGVTWEDVQYPEAKKVTEWYSTEPLVVYLSDDTITVPFQVAKDASPGSVTLSGVLTAQACDHEKCYPVRKVTVNAKLQVTR